MSTVGRATKERWLVCFASRLCLHGSSVGHAQEHADPVGHGHEHVDSAGHMQARLKPEYFWQYLSSISPRTHCFGWTDNRAPPPPLEARSTSNCVAGHENRETVSSRRGIEPPEHAAGILTTRQPRTSEDGVAGQQLEGIAVSKIYCAQNPQVGPRPGAMHPPHVNLSASGA